MTDLTIDAFGIHVHLRTAEPPACHSRPEVTWTPEEWAAFNEWRSHQPQHVVDAEIKQLAERNRKQS